MKSHKQALNEYSLHGIELGLKLASSMADGLFRALLS